jgi:hypothetical protein
MMETVLIWPLALLAGIGGAAAIFAWLRSIAHLPWLLLLRPGITGGFLFAWASVAGMVVIAALGGAEAWWTAGAAGLIVAPIMTIMSANLFAWRRAKALYAAAPADTDVVLVGVDPADLPLQMIKRVFGPRLHGAIAPTFWASRNYILQHRQAELHLQYERPFGKDPS